MNISSFLLGIRYREKMVINIEWSHAGYGTEVLAWISVTKQNNVKTNFVQQQVICAF
jgi:hypothetical protein